MSKRNERQALVKRVAGAIPPEYQLASADGKPSTVPVSLGEGGSSVVVRSIYRGRLQRAMKVVIPRDDLSEAVDAQRFVESYENEVSQLANLNHENISKITDFGSLSLDGHSFPYIVTELIEGRDLLTFARSADVSAHDVMAATKQMLLGLDYMHRHGVLHSDLKPDNVLVRQEAGTTNAVIVDLGASRFLREGSDDDLLYFYSTAKYVHPELRLVLSNRTENRIKRGDLRGYFPRQDLYSVGVVLRDLATDTAVREKLTKQLGSQYVAATSSLSDRLMAGDGPTTAGEVRESLERIDPRSVSLLAVPELSLMPHRGVVIPTLRSRVSSSPRIDEVISHPIFQRLHQLRQLDMLNMVLPGATNSRFVHALHTYELVRQAILYLLADWRVRIEISREDLEITLLSAITSQLGHYHFLHMFEDFFDARERDPKIKTAGLLSDEQLLDAIMAENPEPGSVSERIRTRIGEITDSQGRTMADLIESFGVGWDQVRARLQTPATPLQGALAALLNSPIDAEKLSYIHDDSLATGIPFGAGVRPEPIFESIVVPKHSDWKGQYGGVAIGVRERAISYLEQGVLARYWNIQTAYWNRTNRSVQAMIKFLIAELIASGKFKFEEYIEDTFHLGADGALRWLHEQFERAVSSGAIRDTVNPVAGLLTSERAIYKRLLTVSGASRLPTRKPDRKIFAAVRELSPLQDRVVLEPLERALEELIPGRTIKRGEVLLDLPRQRREEASGSILIYTDDGKTQMGELFATSSFLEHHQTSFELYVKRMRVFLHPRLYQELVSSGQVDAAYDACLDLLRKNWAA